MPNKQKTAYLQRAKATGPRTPQFGDEVEGVEHQATPVSETASTIELRRAVINPRSVSPDAILGLQSRYGNQAVQRLLAKSSRAQVQRGFLGNLADKLVNNISKTRHKDTLSTLEIGDQLNYVLADTTARNLFRVYVKNGGQIENFDAYEFIEKFENSSQSQEMAQEFNQEFVLATADQQINLPAPTVRKFHELLQQENAANYLITNVRNGVLANLLDGFGRFNVTPEYKKWANTKSTHSSI
jgi:phosphoglycolate phosphatase-like HAD superfamily hydrolase